MINNALPIKFIYLLSFFFITIAGYSQLPAFTLTVTPTPQTCLGNGSLSFAVSGNNPAATMSYAVYLLPNTTTPVTTVTTQQANGLVAGNYQVVATQTFSGQSNTATATTTIANDATPLVYSLQTTNTTCGNDGVIQVNVSSGTATGYEIISGPVIRPLQASSVFEDLPSGQYEVRVHNACGDALVTTVQVVGVLNEIYLFPSNLFPGGNLETCGMMDVIVGYMSGDWDQQILFPLTFKYTIHPPGGGAPIIVNNTVSSGFPNGYNEVFTSIPFYNGQQYTYDVEVTDACGNVFFANNNVVLASFTFNVEGSSAGCSNHYLDFSLDKYVLPATVNFLSAPAGFNPSAFNSSHPVANSGAFTYGSGTNSVPQGEYVIQITDACGAICFGQWGVSLFYGD